MMIIYWPHNDPIIVSFILMLFLLLLFRNCCMVQFILLKPLKSNFIQFLEEAWTGQCVECKVPRELLLHTDQLIPSLEIGFERFEENELDHATIPEQEEQQESDQSTVDNMSVWIILYCVVLCYIIQTLIVSTVLLLMFLPNCCTIQFILLKPLKSNF